MGRVASPFLGPNLQCETLASFELDCGRGVYYSTKSPDKTGLNEDSLGYWGHSREAVFVLADGLGGHSQGDEASRLAITQVLLEVARGKKDRHQSILGGIEKVNKKLKSLKVDAGTTLTVVYLKNSIARLYGVGDSIGALFSGGICGYKTYEHSVTGLATESGLMNEEEAMSHPESHVILNSLGDSKARLELSFPLRFVNGDKLVLMSDGVSDNILFSDIETLIQSKSINESGSALIEKCQESMKSGGKLDDYSFLIFEKGNFSVKKKKG